MPRSTRFAHVSINARDWRRLAAFYQEVFGCEPVPPERDQSGAWLDRLTALTGAHLRGLHLRVPGYAAGKAPTLEIYSYETWVGENSPPPPNRVGFAHVAFEVDDVGTTLAKLRNAGGSTVGDRVSQSVPGVGLLDVVYARDPEGNIVEIQNWS